MSNTESEKSVCKKAKIEAETKFSHIVQLLCEWRTLEEVLQKIGTEFLSDVSASQMYLVEGCTKSWIIDAINDRENYPECDEDDDPIEGEHYDIFSFNE